jgi:hypothetical protein
MARAQCSHRPDFVPSAIPSRLPARLSDWQGKPMVRPLGRSTVDQSIAVMSPWLGILGQWCARICAAYWKRSSGSYWQCQATEPPKTSTAAMSRPPYPVQRLPQRNPSGKPSRAFLGPAVENWSGTGGLAHIR